MSTKIYEGYVLPVMDVFELRKFCNGVGKQIREKAGELLAEQIADLSVRIIDRKSAGLDISYFTKDLNADYSPYRLAFFSILNRQEEIKKTNLRDPECDYTCSLVVMPVEDKMPCIFYTEKEPFRKIWQSQKLVKPFPYWNNSERPEELSEEEWEERSRIWDMALGKTGIPSLEGLVFDFSIGVPLLPLQLEEVVKYFPSFDKRVQEVAVDVVTTKKYNEIKNEVGSGSGLDSYLKSRDYLKSEAGQQVLLAERDNLKGILKPILTAEDLRKTDNPGGGRKMTKFELGQRIIIEKSSNRDAYYYGQLIKNFPLGSKGIIAGYCGDHYKIKINGTNRCFLGDEIKIDEEGEIERQEEFNSHLEDILLDEAQVSEEENSKEIKPFKPQFNVREEFAVWVRQNFPDLAKYYKTGEKYSTLLEKREEIMIGARMAYDHAGITTQGCAKTGFNVTFARLSGNQELLARCQELALDYQNGELEHFNMTKRDRNIKKNAGKFFAEYLEDFVRTIERTSVNLDSNHGRHYGTQILRGK